MARPTRRRRPPSGRFREPGFGAGLNFLAPGLGNLYVGEVGRAVSFFGLAAAVAPCSIFVWVGLAPALGKNSPAAGGVAMGLALGVPVATWAWAALDGYNACTRANARAGYRGSALPAKRVALAAGAVLGCLWGLLAASAYAGA